MLLFYPSVFHRSVALYHALQMVQRHLFSEELTKLKILFTKVLLSHKIKILTNDLHRAQSIYKMYFKISIINQRSPLTYFFTCVVAFEQALWSFVMWVNVVFGLMLRGMVEDAVMLPVVLVTDRATPGIINRKSQSIHDQIINFSYFKNTYNV